MKPFVAFSLQYILNYAYTLSNAGSVFCAIFHVSSVLWAFEVKHGGWTVDIFLVSSFPMSIYEQFSHRVGVFIVRMATEIKKVFFKYTRRWTFRGYFDSIGKSSSVDDLRSILANHFDHNLSPLPLRKILSTISGRGRISKSTENLRKSQKILDAAKKESVCARKTTHKSMRELDNLNQNAYCTPGNFTTYSSAKPKIETSNAIFDYIDGE